MARCPSLCSDLEILKVVVQCPARADGLAGIVERNPMQPDPAEFAAPGPARQPSFVDEPVDERDRVQLGQQRSIEIDLVDPAHDLARACRHLAALQRIELHDQNILGRGRAQKRQDRRIAAIAAIPIGHAADLDGAKEQRKTGRRHDHFRSDFLAREDARLAGVHIGRRYEQLEATLAADFLEVDETADDVLERIDVERVEIVGRPEPRQRAEPQALARHEGEQPLDHATLQVRQMAVAAHRAPELGKAGARLLRSTAHQSVGEHCGVERARRGAGNALDLEPAVGEQLIEHAPGKRAVCAAALQREIDPLGLAARGQRIITPYAGHRSRRRPASRRVKCCSNIGNMRLTDPVKIPGTRHVGNGMLHCNIKFWQCNKYQHSGKTG